MARSDWGSLNIDAMKDRLTNAAMGLGLATKSTLVPMLRAFSKEHGVTYRDALMYAEQYYRGNAGDSVVLLDDMLAETKAYWQSVLGKQALTINQPDKAVLCGVGMANEVIVASQFAAKLDAARASLLTLHKGNGFRAARGLSDNASLWTSFCVLCHRNGGVPGISNRSRLASKGLLWFNTHVPATLAAVQADMTAEQYLNHANILLFSPIAGICERGCTIACSRCDRPVNLNFDPVEIGTIRAEKVCRACAKYNLALLEPPKFNRGELRRLNANLGKLQGGVAE